MFWWIVGICRRTDILNRFRMQWRGEAGARGPCLWSTVECPLEVGHCESCRQPSWLNGSSAAPNRRHGDRFSKTSGFYNGLMV